MTDAPSPRFALLAMAALVFPQAVKRRADHQEYLVRAQTIGASKEEAERVLAEVVTELATTGAPGNAYTIAYRRLLDLDAGIARPPESVRAAARHSLLLGGGGIHPEDVDHEARRLMRFAEDWTAMPDTAELLRAEADRLDREGKARKWGLLDSQHRLTDDGAVGRFVALTPDELRFAAELAERLAQEARSPHA